MIESTHRASFFINPDRPDPSSLPTHATIVVIAGESAVILKEAMIQAGKAYFCKVPVEVEVTIGGHGQRNKNSSTERQDRQDSLKFFPPCDD
jgi:hypothetical protein